MFNQLYISLFSQVNCHRDVINCLLDHGANVNKLNDEGLSVLAACHVLFYTRHTWKDNIAETIPEENLFNYIQEDTQKGSYIHRNCRATESEKSDEISEKEKEKENSDDDVSVVEMQNDDETEQQIHIMDKNFETRLSLTIQRGFDKELLKKRTKHIENENEIVKDDDDDNIPTKEKLGKIDTKSTKSTSMFSIMSVVSTKNISSDTHTEDAMSEYSLEQNKECFLTMQR